jgi:hypothetical protein
MILGEESYGEGIWEGLTRISIFTWSNGHQEVKLILDGWKIIELYSPIGMPDIIQVEIYSCVGVVLAIGSRAPNIIGLVFGSVEGMGVNIIIEEHTHNCCIPTLSRQDSSCDSDHGGDTHTSVKIATRTSVIIVDI